MSRKINYNRYKYQTKAENYKSFLATLPSDYDYNQVDRYHESILTAAICNKNYDMINAIIDRVDINGSRKTELYPIELAVLNPNIQIINLLLSRLDFVIRSDDESLHFAAADGNIEVLDILLQKGYDINKLVNKRTVLHWAIQEGDIETVKYLLSHGADVNAVDVEEYETTLNTACGEYKFGNVKQLDIIHLLLDYGANKEQINDSLCAAVCWKNRTLVEVFLANGADANCISHEGYTPLFYAKLRRVTDIEKLLLSFGASQSFTSEQGISISDLENEEIRLREFIKWYYPADELDSLHKIID